MFSNLGSMKNSGKKNKLILASIWLAVIVLRNRKWKFMQQQQCMTNCQSLMEKEKSMDSTCRQVSNF